MRFLRILLLLAATAAVPLRAQTPDAGVAADDAAPQVEQAVIPPGVEPLFADMLGSGQSLPGGCKFSDGQIEHTTVLATYTCQDGEVVLLLQHPDSAPAGGVRTQSFALSVKSGTPPPGLIDAVAERVRAREGAFAWKTVGGGQAPALRKWLTIAAAVLIVAVLIWVVRGHGAKRRAPEE
ncbi:MAG TPA: hypothetical protein VL049_20155 [Candidatus Dormibacteraeota bacterium]|nr:hypothetical protein [Candidatus Dormibacteraeota bacterium]